MGMEFEMKIHDAIYLQVCTEYGDENFDGEFGDEVTWCKDKINDSDIEYVRADLAKQQLQQAGDLLTRLQKADDEFIVGLEKDVLRLKGQLDDLTHDFNALGEQYMELLDLLKEKDALLRQIATGLESK
jgi:hypothetical protein